ncbi:MAG: formylglycine-generating enzyme family protein [Chitinophagaceae bacterium]|uniref:SUMF1/EgtB/PvdO family nonheme iron enzyme n=1 Tax=unclassified Paraflavitalea TaxID=2798305 RepID=UPI003D332B7F|nr:formylglycine-generating enzyme family protein [Chitinophagaceae bacterium]
MKPLVYLAFIVSFIVSFTTSPLKGILKKNFAKVSETLYVSKFEVTNKDYLEYLQDLKQKGDAAEYELRLPDTSSWLKIDPDFKAFVNHYLRHSAYSNYPVVGVSYESAMAYCKWYEEKINASSANQQFRCRLLNIEEWMNAATGGDRTRTYPWGTGFIQNNRKDYLCNFKHTNFIYDSVTRKYTEIDIPETEGVKKATAPVNAYYPNSFGLYNMSGNVAEMTQEKGVAKGGGFKDPAYLVQVKPEKIYKSPQADIGFRIALELIQ